MLRRKHVSGYTPVAVTKQARSAMCKFSSVFGNYLNDLVQDKQTVQV